jgi:hypothetical protein
MEAYDAAGMAVVDAFLRAVPSFEAVKDELWDEISEGLPYVRLGFLINWLGGRVEGGHLEELPAVMAEVEHVLETGDDYAQNLVVVEVIEGLHHLPQVIPFLGPNGRIWWNKQGDWLGGELA